MVISRSSCLRLHGQDSSPSEVVGINILPVLFIHLKCLYYSAIIKSLLLYLLLLSLKRVQCTNSFFSLCSQDGCHFSQDDILALESQCQDESFKGLDILITSCWPRSVSQFASRPVGFVHVHVHVLILLKNDEIYRTLINIIVSY